MPVDATKPKNWFYPNAAKDYSNLQKEEQEISNQYPPSSAGSGKEKDLPSWIEKDSWAAGWLKQENTVSGKGEYGGVEYSNTFNKIGQSKNATDALQNIFVDCIPCGMRFQELGNLNILGDIINAIMNWLNEMLDWLMSLWSMLNNNTFLAELCSLLNFLNFLCLPDLMAILMILQYYVYEILKGIVALFGGGAFAIVWGIISPLMIPIFSELESLLDQWIQMIMGPINCIIASLMTQLNKLGGLTVGNGYNVAPGVTETLWKTFSPAAYEKDPKTKGLVTKPLPQETSAWQREYYDLVYQQETLNQDIARYNALGQTDLAQDATNKSKELDKKIKEHLAKKVPTAADNENLRSAAMRKALNSNASPDDRAKGLKDLDAIGWLALIQRIANSTLYTVSKYLLQARDYINNKIAELKEMLFSAMDFQNNANRMKLLGLERLKEVIRLINIVKTFIDIMTQGGLKCADDETADAMVVIPSMFGLNGPTDITVGNVGISGGTPVKVTDPDTGELLGYTITPKDIDPITGNFISPVNGTSQIPKEININSSDVSKLKNFVSNKSCFTSTPANNKKIKEWMNEMAAKEAALGIA